MTMRANATTTHAYASLLAACRQAAFFLGEHIRTTDGDIARAVLVLNKLTCAIRDAKEARDASQ